MGKIVRWIFVLVAVLVTSGCYYQPYGGAMRYRDRGTVVAVDVGAPVYYAPAPTYYAPPVVPFFYTPFQFYGRSEGHGDRRGNHHDSYRHDDRGWGR